MRELFYKFKNELEKNFELKDIKKITDVLNYVLLDYNVSKKEANIVVYDDVTQRLIELYKMTRIVDGLKERTVKNIVLALNGFFEWANKPYDQVTSNDVRGYMYYSINTLGNKPQSADRKRTTILEFYKWLFEEGHIAKNSVINVPKQKPIEIIKKALSKDEFETMVDCCKTLKEKALVLTMYSTGCRIAELSRLKVADISKDYRSAVVFGKNDKYRTVYFTARARNAVKKYLNERKSKSEYLFCNEKHRDRCLSTDGIRRMFNIIREKACDRLSFRPTPHTMRRTFATDSNAKGMKLEILSKAMGHARVTTTMIYTKINQNTIMTEHERCLG